MTGAGDAACDDENVSPTRGQQARAARIAAELAGLGFALPGTLIERHVRCGKPRCRCHADPPALHGPYWQWTSKVAGKTIPARPRRAARRLPAMARQPPPAPPPHPRTRT